MRSTSMCGLLVSLREARKRTVDSRLIVTKPCPTLLILYYLLTLEQKKVTRKLRQITTQLAAQPTDPALTSQKRALEIDLAYTLHYPLFFKYISLFPSASTSSEEGAENQPS